MLNNEFTIDQNITLFQKEECQRRICVFYFNNNYSSFNRFYICNFNSFNDKCVKATSIVHEDKFHYDLVELAKSQEGSFFYKNCKNYVKEFYYCSRNDIPKKFKFKKTPKYCPEKKEVNNKSKVCLILYCIFGIIINGMIFGLNLHSMEENISIIDEDLLSNCNVLRTDNTDNKILKSKKSSERIRYNEKCKVFNGIKMKCDICLEIKEDISKFPCNCFLNACSICKEKLLKTRDSCPGCRSKIKN